eukprot:7578589-Pyramimonas_sp.AAC.1
MRTLRKQRDIFSSTATPCECMRSRGAWLHPSVLYEDSPFGTLRSLRVHPPPRRATSARRLPDLPPPARGARRRGLFRMSPPHCPLRLARGIG